MYTCALLRVVVLYWLYVPVCTCRCPSCCSQLNCVLLYTKLSCEKAFRTVIKSHNPFRYTTHSAGVPLSVPPPDHPHCSLIATMQPLVVDDLVARVRAFVADIKPPALLVLNLGVEGTDVHKTFRFSVQGDDDLVSTVETLSAPTEPSTSACSSVSTTSSPLHQDDGSVSAAPKEVSFTTNAPVSDPDSRTVVYSTTADVGAQQLQRLVLDDDAVQQTTSAPPSTEVQHTQTDTSPSSGEHGIRQSHRLRSSARRLDYLVVASSSSPSRTRKRPPASTEEESADEAEEVKTEAEVDDSEEQETSAPETATRTRAVRLGSSKLSYVSTSAGSTPGRKKRCGASESQSSTTEQTEVALLVAKLRAARRREVSAEAVSDAALCKLGGEVLTHDGGKVEDGVYQQQAHQIAVLISTSTSLRMVGYYLRAVLAARLKATQQSTFTKAARQLLGIMSTADIAAYPAFYLFVQQHCPKVATGVVNVEVWLKEPVLAADISWTAWRRYLCKPNRWMLDSAMKQFKLITCESTPPLPPLSLSSASMSATPLPSQRSGDVDDMDDVLDWDNQVALFAKQNGTARAKGRKHKRNQPATTTAAMTVSGHVLDTATTKSLQRLRTEHQQLTNDLWNSHTYHLAEHDDDVAVGTTNGEMRQAPFCEVLQTLMFHPSIPAEARLQAERSGAEHFWLDIGSGYGLPVLRARIVSGAKVCAGIEIAKDRVSVSHQLTEKMDMQDQVHFVPSDVCNPQVLPILLAATHLFAFSAVFSDPTRDYLAKVVSRSDSSWLVYATCDKADVLERAGIEVHTEPHGPDCRLGGVHLLGQTKSLSMAVSSQGFRAFIYLRCVASNPREQATTWAAGVAALRERSEAARLQASEEMDSTLTSSRRETRSTRQSTSWTATHNEEITATH